MVNWSVNASAVLFVSADAALPVKLSALDVILNSNSPVWNFKLPVTLGSGIKNVPSTLPLAFVISWLPATGVDASEKLELDGVTWAFTFTLSKKVNTFVFGLNSVPTKEILRVRTTGINALLITRNPCDSLSTCSITSVLTPDLFCIPLRVRISLTTSWPWAFVPITALTCCAPVHCVCHAFHIVPNWFWFASKTASKFPSTLTTNSGATSVSNHSSESGVIAICPTHSWDKSGATFSTLEAKGFEAKTSSV